MRAIIIDAEKQTVSEADIDGKLRSLQEIVGGLIDPVYPGLEGTDHHCYVNDEGLQNNPQHFFMLKDGHQPLAGNGVILSTTGDGDEAPSTLPLEWVKERVTFMDLQDVREWVAREADQEAMQEFPTKAEQVDAILLRMGDMHSHYDIEPRDGGFSLVRAFEIDDSMLAEYGAPAEQVFGWTKTLDEMHDRIIADAVPPKNEDMQPKDSVARAVNQNAREAEPFTAEDITYNPWAAVEKTIPGDASSGLLLQAREAAESCVAEAESYLQHDYESEADYDSGLEVLHTARDRVAELDRLIEPNQQVSLELLETKNAPAGTGLRSWISQAFTMEDLKDDMWSAVDKPIPEHASLDLLRTARSNVADCIQQTVPDHMDTPAYEQSVKRGEELDGLIQEREERRENDRERENYPGRPEVSRWTGEPLGADTGPAQNTGQSQSKR